MKDLFGIIEPISVLPYDGEAIYHDSVLNEADCKSYLDALQQHIEWKNDEVSLFGKTITASRKVAWYGSKTFSYTYSKKTKTALLFTPELWALKAIVERMANCEFNSCLLNLYHNGNEGMAWHSDDETELLENGTIASLSFGASRRFMFKHKINKEQHAIQLAAGSLLVMKSPTQQHWLHSLPKTTKVNELRINLTFRQMK